MKVVIFGASGMVGQGVLLECLRDPGVTLVLSIGRRASGQTHAKLKEIEHQNFLDFSPLATELTGLDACFFCLGVSSVGMSEADYSRVTYDFTLAAARVMLQKSPAMTFIYVSGTGTDSAGKGRSMWARVKGRTENAILALPFKAKYMFRPGYIHPMDGIISKTLIYRLAYIVAMPLYPIAKRLAPNQVTSTVQVGRAMIALARHGGGPSILESAAINRAADQI